MRAKVFIFRNSKLKTFKQLLLLGAVLLCGGYASAEDFAQVQKRMDNDIAAGKPVMVRLLVALADNTHQGIVPVPAKLGNGQNPRTNLYWGARYGIRTYLLKDAGWRLLSSEKNVSSVVLERLILTRHLKRRGKSVKVIIIADAYDGKYMKKTLNDYYQALIGNEELRLPGVGIRLSKTRQPHLVGFIGHNGLMDFDWGSVFGKQKPPAATAHNQSKSTIVLACKSREYFKQRLISLRSNPMVLTNGLMAPEAYTVDAVIKAWVSKGNQQAVHAAAAAAYAKYQRISKNAARRLFHVR